MHRKSSKSHLVYQDRYLISIDNIYGENNFTKLIGRLNIILLLWETLYRTTFLES